VENNELFNNINHVAFMLLTASPEDDFENILLSGMEIIGNCVEADRVQIWTAETRGDSVYIRLKHKWESETGLWDKDDSVGSTLLLPKRWKEIFARGGIISGPIKELTQEDRDFLSAIDIVSTISIPLYHNEEFWGVFCVDDCVKERPFSESEVGILKSAALMFQTTIIKGIQAEQIRDTHLRTQILLDATPLSANLWDENYNMFACNEEAVRTFGMKDKAEYVDRFFELSPERQPDGTLSNDIIITSVKKAFDEGRYTCEFVHQKPDGTPMPSEVTLVRVVYEGGHAVAAYVRDMREYKRMMQDIRDSSQKLEAALEETQKANNAKSDFLASMSHEMRTPLNAVIGLSGLSLENASVDDETYSSLRMIYTAGEMLLGIVNDILDISKIEAGKMDFIELDYDVPGLINETITQNSVLIDDKPLEMRLDVGEDMLSRLHGDELRVKQIMNNLLSNAIKYTDEGVVSLGLRCEQAGDKVLVTITVSDTGKGIRYEDLDKLFREYSQLDLESNRKTEGTGLGLPITKGLAEKMNGAVSVQSVYGQGSIFVVKIEQGFVSDVQIGPEVANSLRSFRYSSEKRGRKDHFKRIRLPYARVLVVDDNVTNLEVAKGLLKAYGMQIDGVTSGQMAIDAIRDEKTRYNAVFMDHMMPDIDGIEATRIIREEIGSDYAKNIPIIAITANALSGNEAMFLSKGFQAFIPKPIELPRLDKVIRLWVRDKEQEKLLEEEELRAPAEEAPGSAGGNFYTAAKSLDIKKGVVLFGDDETYFSVLRSFNLNTVPLLESIMEVSPDKLSAYAVTVHGIKGSSRGICADPLGDLAENLEKAAKAGDFDFISANNAIFIEKAYKLISEIDEAIQFFFPDKPKIRTEEPDPVLLKKLLEACTHFNTDEIDALIAELDSYEYETGGDLFADIVNSAHKYDYRDMQEKLSSMLSDKEG